MAKNATANCGMWALGAIVKNNELISIDKTLNQMTIRQELSTYPYENRPLKELTVEIVLGSHEKDIDSFEDKSNAVYIPTIGTSKVVTNISELQIKPQNYIQVVFDDKKINGEYVAGFLNSKIGRKVLENTRTGTTILHTTKSTIEYLNIPTPSLQKQNKLIKLAAQIHQLAAISESLYFQLWERPAGNALVEKELSKFTAMDDIDYLIKRLPYPLASILRRYTVEDTPDKKREYLNYFFEALAELLATIFISAFYNDPNERNKLFPSVEDKKALKRATFGSWVIICTRFAKRLRELISSNNDEDKEYVKSLLKIDDLQIIQSLVSKDIYIVLDDVRIKRNDWVGHTAPVSETEANRRCELLKSNLDKIYRLLLDIFTSYKLIKARNKMVLNEGIYTVKVDNIIGSDYPFDRSEVYLRGGLDQNYLYFHQDDNNSVLMLLPFIKLRATPHSEKNACYFYNRTEKDGFRWLSYHHETESEIIEDDIKLAVVLKNLVQDTI